MEERLLISKNWLKGLIALDIAMVILALIYDWPKFFDVPTYFIPFIIICPIFPLLLAIVWFLIYRKKKPNNFLLAFAVIPSVVYLVGAIVYYPLWMFKNEFNIYALGQIFWVALYGAQAIWLTRRLKFRALPSYIVGGYLLASFYIQHNYKTFDYLNFMGLRDTTIFRGYVFLAAFTIIFITWLTEQKKKPKW